jgi:hypothetical protein
VRGEKPLNRDRIREIYLAVARYPDIGVSALAQNFKNRAADKPAMAGNENS